MCSRGPWATCARLRMRPAIATLAMMLTAGVVYGQGKKAQDDTLSPLTTAVSPGFLQNQGPSPGPRLSEPTEVGLAAALEQDPSNAEISFQLSQVLWQQKARQPEALFHWARAAYFEGPGAKPRRSRGQIRAGFEKALTKYTGSMRDSAKLERLARSNAFPPRGFRLPSRSERCSGEGLPLNRLWKAATKRPAKPECALAQAAE